MWITFYILKLECIINFNIIINKVFELNNDIKYLHVQEKIILKWSNYVIRF
jgi:hypothetical protein